MGILVFIFYFYATKYLRHFHPSLRATYSSPYSLISIGMEALATLHDHTIHFTDLKTRNKLYYTIDNPGVGLGARNLAGHFSLPMFAYSETVMRPTIHIVRYPDMHKLLQLRCMYEVFRHTIYYILIHSHVF